MINIKYTEKTYFNGEKYIEMVDSDGKIWFIPANPANSDYQRYLRWLENPDAEEGGIL